MPNVTLVNEQGVEEQIDLVGQRFQFVTEDAIYDPLITREVEIATNGDVDRTTDQCGNSQQRNTGGNLYNITVSGIVSNTEEQIGERGGKPIYTLTGTRILDDLSKGATATIVTALKTVDIDVSSSSVIDSSELVSIETTQFGREDAFEFQIQFGERGK